MGLKNVRAAIVGATAAALCASAAAGMAPMTDLGAAAAVGESGVMWATWNTNRKIRSKDPSGALALVRWSFDRGTGYGRATR